MGPVHRIACHLLLAASCLVIACGLASRWTAMDIWDDALMFSRYAENLERSGAVAWNPDGEPTWGLTSVAFLAPVSVLRAVLPGQPAAWPVLASWLSGVAFLGLLALLIRRHLDRRLRLPAATLVALTLALDARSSLHHWASGMDTTFALAWLTACLLALESWWHRRSDPSQPTRPGIAVRQAAPVAVLVAGTFLVRPDVLVFPCALVGIFVLWPPPGTGRRAALVLAGLSAALLGGIWLACFAYFHQPLPLPFFAKSTGLYDAAFRAAYDGVARDQFVEFLFFHGPLVVLSLVTMVLLSSKPGRTDGARSHGPDLDSVDLGLLVGILVFEAYHLTLVVPVMYFEERFFQPLLPPLLWLVLRNLGPVLDRVPVRKTPGATRAVDVGTVAGTVVVLALLAWVGHGEAGRWAARARADQLGDFDLHSIYGQRARHYWVALDTVADLAAEQDDEEGSDGGLVLAATEVGAPSAMAPAATVHDMAGLHDAEVARHGFSADRLFDEQRPDLIYLPHPDYQGLHEALRGHPGLDHYEVFEREELHAVLAVAIRRDSRFFDVLHRAVQARRDQVTRDRGDAASSEP